ncbi:MAG TPA: class II fumarate hydratase [Candidatus Methylomirabilis sp.]|nr:class II fumarate hydratase [Candidatus Methylomirabilis sp.]
MGGDEHRIEQDSMGDVRVPARAYYGAQTQRAVENFPVSGLRFPPSFIRALGMIKLCAARVNLELGLLERTVAEAIIQAAREVVEGKWDGEFVLDIFQTGSGTSTNMNANEVIANRAIELLGGRIGSKRPAHPNDHVNLGQSSNDVIPTAIHLAALQEIERDLVPALRKLHQVLLAKAQEFDRVVKIGRTHLQDATPIRLGQEFSGYARQVELGLARIDRARPSLQELALGGTAVGTGINTHPEFPARVIRLLAEMTRLPFTEAKNHFEAQGSQDALVETSGVLKTIAVSLMKIANDVRWLGSGPRCGIGELLLPAIQPGSSIMPGKVNPVIPEAVIQVAAQVIGNDACITIGGQGGYFELNLMLPVMADNLLQSIALLASASRIFADRCLAGIRADEARCAALIELSLAMCTALAPVIGYDAAAKIAKESYETGKTVRQVAREHRVLPAEEIDRVLDPWRMTERGIVGRGEG